MICKIVFDAEYIGIMLSVATLQDMCYFKEST